MQVSTHRRCLGALLRKHRTWPPRWSRSPSEARNLARPRTWQPRSWVKTPFVTIGLCLLAFLQAGPIRAQASLEPVGAGTLLFLDEDGARIAAPRVHTAVRMHITGLIARVEVRQTFHNPGERWVEGLYAFPLPENAAVDRLRMQVGERIVVGEIREKVEAQRLYEQARAQGRRASVVHQKRPNLFRTAVANIGPGESIEITIGYLQIADQDGARYSVRLPLTITPRYLPDVVLDTPDAALHPERPTASVSLAASGDDTSTLGDLHPRLAHADTTRQRVSIDIDLDAGVDIERIASTHHAVNIERAGRRARVSLRREHVPPDRDFELAWSPAVHGEPEAVVFRERTAAGEHLLLMFMPPQNDVRLSAPREVIFVVDTSGSMGGQSIEQARAALLTGLETLTPADRFAVIQFNSVHEALFEAPVPATDLNLAQARRYVRALRATGGTEMLPALNAAFAMPTSRAHLRQIVFITDGAVGNEDQLMRAVRERLGNARLFTVGIGSAPNGHLMRRIAQMGRGTFTFIGSTDEVDRRMSALLHKLTRPVLTDLELHWPAGTTVEHAPAQMTDLYAGEPVVIAARLQGEARGILTVSGRSDGVWTRQISLGTVAARPGVATLWARQRIADLMDSRADGVSSEIIRNQVLPLALEYQLVSNYTSLVAVDRTPARPEGTPLDARRVANTTPHGLNWPDAGYPSTATPAGWQLALGALLLLLTLCLLRVERRALRTRT